MPTYRWATPYEWLAEKSEEWSETRLHFELLELAIKHDFDTLQDIYQYCMDEDGYFEPIEED